MKKLNLILPILLTIALMTNVSTIFAQNGKLEAIERIKSQKRVLEANKNKGNNNSPKSQLTPEQLEAINKKRANRPKLSPEERAERMESQQRAEKLKDVSPINNGGNAQMKSAKNKGEWYQGPNKGTPLTKDGLKNKNISKARTLATVTKGNARVDAGNKKLGMAKAKLAIMKNSGKYSPEQIKEKEIVLAKYQEHLLRLKASIQTGSKRARQ